EIRVGSSSRDIRLTAGVTLAGGDAAAPLHQNSTLREFLADARGEGWLRERVGESAFGSGLLDTELGQMVMSVPICRFARFPGSGFTEADVDAFLVSVATSR
ncbi:MAG TPA: hypothetical protein VME01_09830, partial [Solirubrobacteraceae bacterium]|nr:hypothetical protein [Solirubrobacteraceae bacterium]